MTYILYEMKNFPNFFVVGVCVLTWLVDFGYLVVEEVGVILFLTQPSNHPVCAQVCFAAQFLDRESALLS